VAHAVPCVRPEENIVQGLEERLGPEQTKKLLLAFVELLRVNGYFSRLQAMEMWLATRFLKFMVTPDRVRKRLADDTTLESTTRERGKAIANGQVQTNPPGAPPTIVVMGHTHVLDTTQNRYVNLGTWIDHVPGLADGQLSCSDLSLPVLVIDGDVASLYDCQNMVGTVASTGPLWSSP
jgi:hypothetical protein